MNIDDGTLVEAARSRRELYDKGHPGWKNAAIKDADWASIGEALSAPASDCSARWHTLRERYNKEKRRQELMTRSGSGGGSSVNIVWPYYEAMKFLEPYIRKRRGVSNLTVALAYSAAGASRDALPDASNFFNENGELLVYADAEIGDSDQSATASVANDEYIDIVSGSASSSESSLASFPVTSPSCPASQQECPATPQPSSADPNHNAHLYHK